ncbi:Chloride channel protein [hydrothermal vent metagenome]|uniref:Chloride channel protein n=1 Tax=hydrothermal vent metagenome TaxID=652676 RepID=A0A3B1CI44_9ZZZZ
MSLRLKRAILRSRKKSFHFLNLVTLSEERTLMMLAVVVGLASGISAFIFKHMIDGVYHFCCSAEPSSSLSSGHWFRVFLPAIGGLLGGLVIYFFAKEAKGHGVPEAIYALRRRGGRGRPRVVLVKSVASAFTIGTGGSAGTEGPIIQIGAAVGSSIGQLFNVSPAYLKTLAAAGAAGGMAAVFNAPIAAVIFAMEVLLREFTTQAFSMVVFSSVIASVTSHILLGDNTFLPSPAFGIQHPAELGLYFILGIIAAPLASIFSKTLFFAEGFTDRFKKIPDPIKAMIGGLIVGVIGLFLPQILGAGYFEVTDILSPGGGATTWGMLLLFSLVIGKIICTSITLGSGGSGGILMPSLFIGAMMGSLYGQFAHTIFPNIAPAGAYALVGMGLIFSVVANAPVTAIVMMFEITQDYRIILPLMFSVTITMIMARQMGEVGIYARVLLARGVKLDGGEAHDPVMTMTASEVMVKNIEIVSQNMTVERLAQIIDESHHTGFPVINGQGELVGMVTYVEIHKAYQDRVDLQKTLIEKIMRSDLPLSDPEDVLVDVVRRMQESETDRIAVVEPDNPKRLVGLITRADIMSAYRASP